MLRVLSDGCGGGERPGSMMRGEMEEVGLWGLGRQDGEGADGVVYNDISVFPVNFCRLDAQDVHAQLGGLINWLQMQKCAPILTWYMCPN